MESPYYVGVDVGTGSVRAALVSHTGHIITNATHPIKIFEPQPGFYEQSSTDIWLACCKVVQMVTNGVEKDDVHGIGFDATCSMVVLDSSGNPISVSPSGEVEWNIVMWMDHRAEIQAARINATKHPALKYAGGTISLEMQTPKLLWLKENLKEQCWEKAAHYFDLPDFLTWRATGCASRSLCSVVCKWMYQYSVDGYKGWDRDYFTQIGLGDLLDNNYSKIGSEVQAPGEAVGKGLSAQAAEEMGLRPGLPVGTSLIDAQAGGLGSLGCNATFPDGSKIPVTSHMALIGGTSTCHMVVSDSPVFVPGVWGPYFSAMVSGLWGNEGGQSSTGKLIDHIVERHAAFPWVKDEAEKRNVHPQTILNEILENKATVEKLSSLSELSKALHVWPDYHGNRSPLADSTLTGMVCGLTLSSGVEDLALQYLATIQSLAYGTRHILDSMRKSGYDIKIIHMCGGLAKNNIYVQTHADVTGLPILLPHTSESVLLGSAILAAYASGDFTSIQDAMFKMGGTGTMVIPNAALQSYHGKKYHVFLKMVEHQCEYTKIMSSASSSSLS